MKIWAVLVLPKTLSRLLKILLMHGIVLLRKQGNGLEGLKEQWDEYFDNIIKKQILMRAGKKYIQPLLDEVDNAVGERNYFARNGNAS